MSIQTNKLPDNPQIEVIKSGKTGLFTNYIYKAIPLAFDESMSYYETLLGLLNYLKNVILPTVNNNADAVAELQTLYEELRTYVDDYFKGLDVQEEINNKLDEMVKDGTLPEIIASYLNSKALFGFDNVASMKNSINLINGSYAKTLGYYEKNDGGASVYKIRTITNEDIVDEKSIISLNNELLVAEIVCIDKINVHQFGAKGDNKTNDYDAIQSTINYAFEHNLVVEFLTKSYKINNTLKLYTNSIYNGNNCTITETSNVPVMANIKYFDKTQNGYHVTINDFYLEGNIENENNDGLILCGYYTRVNNVTVRNVGGHGIVVTSYTIDGTEFEGTSMVEGMITNTKAYSKNPNKYPFYQHCDNINITDWRIENCIFAGDNCKNFMRFDRIAGWYLTDVQCYGKSTENGIYSNFGSGTQIENLTIDGIMYGGLFIDSQIGSINASNIHINVHPDATGDIYAIRQTGGSSNTNSLTISNINVNVPNNTTPSNLYLHRGSAYIFDVVNPIFMKNHQEIAYKLYYYKGNNDTYRINGFNVSTDTPINENITNLAKHYNVEQYSNTSTTLSLTIKPSSLIRNSGLLIITGEVNGKSKGSSVYSIGLMRRGTSQPCHLVSEQTGFEFTNVSVTYDSTTNTYTINATTPETSNCQYSMSVIY